jgi:hypothetical protein
MSEYIYTDHQSQKFCLIEHYVVPGERQDEDWVRYQNIRTNDIFTCRLEAFESRFQKAPKDDR